uniref:RING-type domain-containing protein n=1 Tax=Globodera pallida TaxID=36090 RepID=A0A183C474_GLOPA
MDNRRLHHQNTFTEPNSDGVENEKDEQFLGLSEHISCPLCGDFLSDAVTLTGCLHFFCRLCLLRHISSESASKNCCPKCDVQLGPEKPFFHRDPALQELVFKLVPDIFWRRLARVARSRRRPSRKSLSERHILKRRRLIQLSTALCSPDEKISVQIDYVPLAEVLAANRNLMEPNVEVSPSTSSKAVADTKKQLFFFRRFFRCAARVRIEQLKRLLELKLAMTDSYGLYFVDGALQNVLEDDYTLEDIVHLFNWNRESPLPLLFTLAKLAQEDEDKPPVLEEMPQLEVEGDPAIVPVRKSAEKLLVGEELMDSGGKAAERKESGDGPKRAEETSAPALPEGPTTPDSPQLSLGTSQPCLLPSTSSETLPNSSSSLPVNGQTNKKDKRKKKDVGCAAKKQQSLLNGTVADAFGVVFANAFLAQHQQQFNQMIGGMMEVASANRKVQTTQAQKATPQNGINTKGNNDNISKACGGTSSAKPTREDRPSMVGQAPTSSGTSRCPPMPTSSSDHHNGNIGGSAVQKAKASSHCVYPKGKSGGFVTNVAQHLKQQQKPQQQLMLNDQASRHATSVLKATLPG